MNGSKPQALEVIARLMASERMQESTHFSERVYADEPIITTGRQMASYLPEEYRAMRAISRWEEGAAGAQGRWLSEAELFYRQGMLMADYEDDCPYHGTFKSYFPTYNAMSDRQLRGYFTWRAAVRRGSVEETSLSFAYIYMYELINGIGVSNPREGFDKLESFWRSYRAFSPEIDRFASVWLQDYAVYHGLPAQLLEPYKALSFDRALLALRAADGHALELAGGTARSGKRRGKVSALPLPANDAFEQELFEALDALSTYRLTGSRLYKQQPDALRHIACAVYVRMSSYYRKQRSGDLLESWFGKEVSLAYTMFASAVFFEPTPHADAVYELDPIHLYRCVRGHWSCERYHGSRSQSPKLGNLMHAADRALREALGFAHPLKETGKTPKYVQKFIDEEIAAWMEWHAAHAPRHIEIDLGQLAGIRATAALTRESLLIDEEREGEGSLLDFTDTLVSPSHAKTDMAGTDTAPSVAATGAPQIPAATPPGSPATAAADTKGPAPLSAHELEYLNALLAGDAGTSADVVRASDRTEDLLMDAINEALFDLVGDTVLEYGPDGPAVIEDYRDEVEGMLRHG
ncbi:MAG: TerB N-terminal domain-containing protein [Coriobacteriaceae bacterium]|nr:TerB N-terminal domain-containing protein [Coriobacteriaceae bacterium]